MKLLITSLVFANFFITISADTQGIILLKEQTIEQLKHFEGNANEIKSVTDAFDAINKLFCTDPDKPLPDDIVNKTLHCEWEGTNPHLYSEDCEEQYFKGKTLQEQRKFICTATKDDVDIMTKVVNKCITEKREKAKSAGKAVNATVEEMKPEEVRGKIVKSVNDLLTCTLKAMKKSRP